VFILFVAALDAGNIAGANDVKPRCEIFANSSSSDYQKVPTPVTFT